MNAYSIPQNMFAALSALVLALALLAGSNAQAADVQPGFDKAAFEQGLLHVEFERAEPQNTDELRRLLSVQNLDADARVDLERALDGLYEELG